MMRTPSMLRMRRRIGAVLTAIAVALGGAVLGSPSQAEARAASPHQLRVITHNIAGATEFDGYPGALEGVNSQIDAFAPDVVMLTEVCESQVRAFEKEHPTWHFRFAVMVENQRRCESSGPGEPLGQRQGQMLASPHPISDRDEFPLGHPDVDYYDDGELRLKRFTLLCGDIHIPGHAPDGLRACVTHLRAFTDPEDHKAREDQTKEIRRLLHDDIWEQGKAVTVGGDFNAKPNWNAMDNMYRLSRDSKYTGVGDFHEADQTDPKYFDDHGSVTCGPRACRSGQATKDVRKLDYVFISRNVTHGGRVSGLAPGYYGSDHKLYRALFEIQY